MKDRDEAEDKRFDPGSAVGYKMIYMILSVIVAAISLTIELS